MNPAAGRFLAVTLTGSLLLFSGCGTSGPTYPQNVSVTMSPKPASLAAGSTQQFTATVANYSAPPAWFVQFSIVPVGTISSTGLYTAPATPPAINYGGANGPQAVVTISANVYYPVPNLLLGASASDSDTLIITAPAVTAGFITNTATVPLGGTFKFQPYAVGNVNRAYTLQVNGVTGGSLGTGTIVQDSVNAGLYTAPTVMPMTGNTVTITVISVADPTRTATATVTLQ